MLETASGRDPVEELAEEYLERLRRGENPRVEEYAERYPDHATDIRELFPALAKIEHLRPDSETSAGGEGQPAGRLQLQQLGDFRILREVGRGGMGIVYEAEQVSLGRHVALKVLPHHAMLDPRRLQRFRREARAAARLHHTNIVPVFGVGEQDGIPYIVMQFISGLGLDDVLDELRRLRVKTPSQARPARRRGDTSTESFAGLSVEEVARTLVSNHGPAGSTPPESAPSSNRSSVHLPGQPEGASLSESGRSYWQSVARVGVQVAEALAYAASQGILHRDIKPSNLLLDAHGTVWVTDFGLAKVDTDADDLTQTGDILGTLRYVAPERLSGRGDIRSDVYSLGLTLYELITFRPAYEDSARDRLLSRIVHDDPPPPRWVNPAVPRDLETVVLKAIAREPARRYATADALAADLQRFLEDRPVLARRVGLREQAWRWCKRNPAVATLLVMLLFAFLGGFAGVAWQWRRAEAKAVEAAEAAVEARFQAARAYFGEGRAHAERGDVAGGVLWMAEALRATPEGKSEFEALLRQNIAAWQERLPTLAWRITAGEGPEAGAIGRMAPSPDGTRIWTACGIGGLKGFDAVTGQPLGPALREDGPCHAVVYNFDGSRLATGHDGLIRIRDGRTGQPVGPPLHLETSAGQPSQSWILQFSRDGSRLAVNEWGPARWLAIYDVATGRRLTPVRNGLLGGAMSFVQQDRVLITNFQVGSGPLTPGFYPLDAQTLEPAGPAMNAALSNVGELQVGLATSRDGTVLLMWKQRRAQLWNAVTRQPLGPALPLEVNGGAFRPDGRILALAGPDRDILFWDRATGTLVGTPLAHDSDVTHLDFLDDRSLLVRCGQDASLRLWKLGDALAAPATEAMGLPLAWEKRADPVFSPDGTRFATIRGGWVRLYDAATALPQGLPIPLPFPGANGFVLSSVHFSPDSTRIATVCNGPAIRCTVRIWDARTGEPVTPSFHPPNSVVPNAAAFSPDGSRFATADYSDGLDLWDTASGRRSRPRIRLRNIAWCVAFSPDGKTIAVGTVRDRNPNEPPQVRFWDVASGRETASAIQLDRWPTRLAISADGEVLLVTGGRGHVSLWDARRGAPLPGAAPLPIENGDAVVFRADGRAVLVGTGDGTVQLWDARTGRSISPPMGYDRSVSCLAFQPEGRAFAAGYTDGTVRLWDFTTAQPVGPPMHLGNRIRDLHFVDGGRALLAAAVDGTVRRWRPAEAVRETADALARRLEAATGKSVSAGQGLVRLDASAWRERLDDDTVRSEVGESLDREIELAWHEREALDAERRAEHMVAVWHLDRLLEARPQDGLLQTRGAWELASDGQREAAAAGFARALEVGPAQRCVDLLAHRALDAELDGKVELALWGIDQALTARPDDGRIQEIRAATLERLGRMDQALDALWKGASSTHTDPELVLRAAGHFSWNRRWQEAALAYEHLRRQGKLAEEDWQPQALAYLLAGNRAGYRALCATILETLSTRRISPNEANNLAWIFALGPGAVDPGCRVLALAEQALASIPSTAPGAAWHNVLNTYGAVLHRAGRHAEAVARLREGITRDGNRAVPEDWLFLALAYVALGDLDKARECLSQVPAQPDDPLRLALRGEAEALILDSSFPADPFARLPQ
jgi:serine/threonine protein kinase/WD40 repeat protein/Tfp pilus assembly protein PilF